MEIGLNCSMSEWLSIVTYEKNTENRILGHIEQGSNLNANLFQCFHDPRAGRAAIHTSSSFFSLITIECQ